MARSLAVTWSVLSSFAFVRFVDGYLATGRGASTQLLGAAVCLGLAGCVNTQRCL
ncbi:MAG: hypothetical protein HC929_08915 [Leptolyngbyaceae cyanobacterium SM2_5_2]|nr:hypothetical protein [Leptolyngbyaceae cyanobacterium SM2_5_2]